MWKSKCYKEIIALVLNFKWRFLSKSADITNISVLNDLWNILCDTNKEGDRNAYNVCESAKF